MGQEKRRLSPAELKRVGWGALVQKLGLADATRFLLEYASGSGDYVQLKEQLFARAELSAQKEWSCRRGRRMRLKGW